MLSKKILYLIVNFGGPRTVEEIYPFLKALLTDQDVIRTSFPKWFHTFLFSWVAKRRVSKVRKEYISMGGGSPIYRDTEEVAHRVRKQMNAPLITFHRYLPLTHSDFIREIEGVDCNEIRVFPMFPQFTFATSGSIARWFKTHLSSITIQKMRWIRSYPSHPSFVGSYQQIIREFMHERELQEENTLLIFSAHGIPLSFAETGDSYPQECEASFQSVMAVFPNLLGKLSYQSKFGGGEWIKPYTIDVCHKILEWNEGRKEIIFVPIAFTSDHIETLCEIENDYMSIIREKGCRAYRIPALNLHPSWIQGIPKIIRESDLCSSEELIYHDRNY